MTQVTIGAFYNPHLGKELAQAEGIDHLAMADPPAATDPWWPAIRERYTLLLHDHLGQLSEPLDERSITRARALAELYDSPWVAEHFQCLHTVDGAYNLNYVFPPLYTEEFLDRFVRNATALKARLDQPLVMENIPGFFDVAASQLPEPLWLRRFFDATGAGFLLDLPHVWLAAPDQGPQPAPTSPAAFSSRSPAGGIPSGPRCWCKRWAHWPGTRASWSLPICVPRDAWWYRRGAGASAATASWGSSSTPSRCAPGAGSR